MVHPDGASLPVWARELVATLPVTSQFILTGNTHDLYLVEEGDGDVRFPTLSALLAMALERRGVDNLLEFDISLGVSLTSGDAASVERLLGTSLDELAGGDPSKPMGGLGDLIKAVTTAREEPLALLIHRADKLVSDPRRLNDEEFREFRRFDYLARAARPIARGGTEANYNPVVWQIRNAADLPAGFAAGCDQVRRIAVGFPDTETRLRAAAKWLGSTQPSAYRVNPVRIFADVTSGMRLTEMQKIDGLRKDSDLPAEEIDDAARSYRVGIVENPWRQEYLRERLRRELEDPRGSDPTTAPVAGADEPDGSTDEHRTLRDRVLGQEAAVRKSLDILVRSVTNMTGAHASSSSTRPRGVLFFAGPTGVGKTELAKSITRLLHGSVDSYIRFDMSEFSSEHAADRLIGAPPGFVGYDAGGELTNAIRRNPFSVVLFDEIEKAHHQILDKFLQILDDGRLTDGRGETVYFSEAVIIFTSNLGIYEEAEIDGRRTRVPNIRREDQLPYSEIAERVVRSISEYFTLQLGRPELLNRIGVDNIVVFDFIDERSGLLILEKDLSNVVTRVADESPGPPWRLRPSEAVWEVLKRQCLSPQVLNMGGRGIGARLETVLVNPLAREIFLTDIPPGATITISSIEETDDIWRVTLEVESDLSAVQ